jgi:hypothetical protein
LGDTALLYLVSRLKDELVLVHTSISETRSRASQLLAVAGFVTVLATLGASIPSRGVTRVVSYALAAVALYALVGTLWLTAQALAVMSWEEVEVEAPAPGITLRRLHEAHLSDLYRVRCSLSVRLTRPVGYLRDAYWYFLATVVAILALVVLRFLPVI